MNILQWTASLLLQFQSQHDCYVGNYGDLKLKIPSTDILPTKYHKNWPIYSKVITEHRKRAQSHKAIIFSFSKPGPKRSIWNKHQQEQKITISFHIPFSYLQANRMPRFQCTDWAIIPISQYMDSSYWNIT